MWISKKKLKEIEDEVTALRKEASDHAEFTKLLQYELVRKICYNSDVKEMCNFELLKYLYEKLDIEKPKSEYDFTRGRGKCGGGAPGPGYTIPCPPKRNEYITIMETGKPDLSVRVAMDEINIPPDVRRKMTSVHVWDPVSRIIRDRHLLQHLRDSGQKARVIACTPQDLEKIKLSEWRDVFQL